MLSSKCSAIRAAALALVASFAVAQAQAQGAITFKSSAPAEPLVHMPGISRLELQPVTPEESEAAIRAQAVPANLNPGVTPLGAQLRSLREAEQAPSASQPTERALRVAGDAAPSAPASIAELARALRHDPDLIYEHVRNNIGYVPMWGVKKGAFGAILDNQGTAFDQAALMVELLRASGYTANYVKGRIALNAAQVGAWMDVDTSKVCSVLTVLGNGRVPTTGVIASAAGSCPGSTAALVSLKLDHVWVKVTIGGTNYYFDPSYKPHARKTGIDLAAATGYNAASFLSSATSGSTGTADYIQNLNRTNVRSSLATYAGNLASHLRSNVPAATLDDAIGGMVIVPHDGSKLRQATLPYQDTGVALTEWTDIAASYKPTLRIRHAGIDVTYSSDGRATSPARCN